MKRLKHLYTLWHDYEFGQSDSMNAAKHFTSVMRGHNKFEHNRRSVFWNLVPYMIERGYTGAVAIDKIYGTLG